MRWFFNTLPQGGGRDEEISLDLFLFFHNNRFWMCNLLCIFLHNFRELRECLIRRSSYLLKSFQTEEMNFFRKYILCRKSNSTQRWETKKPGKYLKWKVLQQ